MKDIAGYEYLYGITSCGKVWSYRSQKFLAINPNQKGYLQVGLCKNGERKMLKIHRLVAEAYLPNPNNYDTVDHIDGDRTNNCVNNLQWMAAKDNTRKGTSKKVKCLNTGEIFNSITIAAEYFNVSKEVIERSLKNNKPTRKGLWFVKI